MELGSLIGFGQLGIFFAVTYLYVKRYGSHLSNVDRWTAIWFGFDGLCHLLFEGVYVLFTCFGTVKKSNSYIALPCTSRTISRRLGKHQHESIVGAKILCLTLLPLFPLSRRE